MKNSPLRTYIKSILFRKLPWQQTFQISVIVAMIINVIIMINSSLEAFTFHMITNGVLLAFIYLVFLIDTGLSNYRYYKKYEYGKTKIPDDISKIKSEASPDLVAIVKQLDERVEKVEKESPIRWMFISIFFTLFLTVAVSIVLYILPKILPK